MIEIGVIFIIGTVIGNRIVVFIPKENRKRVIKGSVILLIGTIVLMTLIPSTIRISVWARHLFNRFFFPNLDLIIIGIALILTGIFTIRPTQSRNGKTSLGIHR